ncbi:MAG: S41 family peptidase [Peptococcaceae bacterium]|nr:S41 family peptidase [Peptococcaceae bacterium]
MNRAWKLLRDVVLTICCLTTLCVGVLVVTNFEHVQKIVRTVALIEQKYLWESDAGTLADGAVKGMLDGLGDKYTTYIDADTITGFMEQVSGDVYGIGVYTAEDENGDIVILSLVPESPAEAAGIEAGDIIRAIDGESTADMTLDEAVSLMRGRPDTSAEITVERSGTEYTYVVNRFKLGNTVTVAGTILEEHPDIAYLRISEFSVQTGTEFAEQVNALIKEGFSGMILDLRDNGGGEVNSAVEVARVFVPSGPIVHVVSGDGRVDTKSATEAQLEVPMVVLVNGNTASASEILAAALKDSGTATLVGTQTFGKALVQGVYMYADGTAMKITEAKYLTPKQNDINGVGISPDVKVELPADAATDIQLERAIKVLQDKMR